MKKFRICPECYSTNIKEDWKLKGTLYECLDCLYRGVIVIDVPLSTIKKLKKKKKI